MFLILHPHILKLLLYSHCIIKSVLLFFKKLVFKNKYIYIYTFNFFIINFGRKFRFLYIVWNNWLGIYERQQVQVYRLRFIYDFIWQRINSEKIYWLKDEKIWRKVDILAQFVLLAHEFWKQNIFKKVLWIIQTVLSFTKRILSLWIYFYWTDCWPYFCGNEF